MVPSQLNNRRDGPEAVLEPRLENRGGMIDQVGVSRELGLQGHPDSSPPGLIFHFLSSQPQ